jgi:hypothetical protein
LVRRLIKKARRRLPLPAAEAQPAQRKLGTDETAVLVKSSENAANVLGDAGGQVFGGQQEGEGFQQKDQNSVLVVEASSSTSSSLTAKVLMIFICLINIY